MSFKQVLITDGNICELCNTLPLPDYWKPYLNTTPFSIPGSIVGMLILFILLALQIIPSEVGTTRCAFC